MTNISRLRHHSYSLLLAFVFYLISTGPAFAQTSAFTYQERLTDSGNPADGLFDMQFKLFDTDVQPFDAGLDIVRRLRSISFNWKDGGQRDVGFAAEEVEQIEPLLVTYNKQGQIEGVKYKQITTVLVNAVRELQAQIDSLKKIVCQDHPDRDFCKPK